MVKRYVCDVCRKNQAKYKLNVLFRGYDYQEHKQKSLAMLNLIDVCEACLPPIMGRLKHVVSNLNNLRGMKSEQKKKSKPEGE
ncbi:hypothetical protein DRO51_01445 [Candidatus Bathyarchaeota archaeon]|nr:MAG: hypothetical protein DRO51_01445 [Candidatus Bathyarchaeota archaeon]